MATPFKYIVLATVAFGIAGCGTSNMEAGSQIDNGSFGNATMHNMQAQMASRCAGKGKGYIVPEPMVVLDPGSSAAEPRYMRATIRCSGQLNGKYARVIHTEYVASAAQLPVGGTLTAGTGG